MDWKVKPTVIEYWPKGVNIVLAFDENGISEIKHIRKSNKYNQPVLNDSEIIFTLTGVVLDRESFIVLKEQFEQIKNKYWDNGMYNYKGVTKKVCFHSYDIRKKNAPFNINRYDEFIEDLTSTLDIINYNIISVTINKLELMNRYFYVDNPYNLAIHFILERYCHLLNKLNQKGIIILESRDPRKDKHVLNHIVNVTENGTEYNKPEHFQNFVGAFFNPKWKKDNDETYVALELADLVSYPVYKYYRYNRKDKDFQLIEKKFYKYPYHEGWGIKYFPK